MMVIVLESILGAIYIISLLVKISCGRIIVRKLKTERFETEDPTWSRKILRYIDDHRVYCDYTVKNEEFILNRIKELVELVDAIEFLEKQ